MINLIPKKCSIAVGDLIYRRASRSTRMIAEVTSVRKDSFGGLLISYTVVVALSEDSFRIGAGKNCDIPLSLYSNRDDLIIKLNKRSIKFFKLFNNPSAERS